MKASSLVRRSRRRAGLSQRALAEQAGVPQSTIGRIEAGLTDPRTATVSKILKACGFELEAQRRLGEGVDRSQIQEFLALTPLQRIESAVAARASLGRIRRARKTR